jgi:DNA-binding CsgD family transcriptional regulator/tetratricopeptide (TPR) repeat protein
VLAGSAAELEGELPFAVFVDALDEYLEGLEPHRLDALDDEVRGELAHVFPAIDGDGPATPGDRYRTHRAVGRLLEALATPKPLVLLLDDLHWADAGTCELLGSLLRRPPGAPVLIALTLRPRQMPERLAVALERAHRAGTLERLRLVGLNRAEAHELLGGEVDAGALYEHSGGNPFYLEQLARSPHAGDAGVPDGAVSLAGVQVPRGVAAALAEELAMLSDGARRVLDGAAVAGDPFEPELAAAAAGVSEPVAVEALDELLRADLIRPTEVPRRFRFRHPLVRGGVYEAAPGGWRLGAHERCADALAARGASAAARAHHVEHAGRRGDPAAAGVLREAGESAVARDPVTAARLFAGALRLLAPDAPLEERVALLSAQAQAHMAAGQFFDSYDAWLEALERMKGAPLASRIALIAACAALENLLGEHAKAHHRLMTALDAAGGDATPEAVALLIELAVDGLYRVDYATAARWGERALAAARQLPAGPPAASAAGVYALALANAGRFEDAREVVFEGALRVDGMRDEELATCIDRAADALAAAEQKLGLLEAAERHSERALALARATGQGNVLPILFWAGQMRVARGRLDDARDVYETAVAIARMTGHAEGLAWTLLGRTSAGTAAGEIDAALTDGGEAMQVLAELQESWPALWAAYEYGAALIESGAAQRGEELLLARLGGESLDRSDTHGRVNILELLTRARLARGDVERAAAAAARAEASAEEMGLPLPRAMAARASAAVALATDEPAVAAELALRSAAGFAGPGAAVEEARSRLLAGQALAAAGDPGRAAEELSAAAAAFQDCGAIPRRDEAERELRRLGHKRLHRRTRPGQADGGGVASLTERELQVARLIVDRRTNAEIASELFLSTKTVESHVRNLFQKLGVSSRVEVARVVERAERTAAR